ADETLVQVHLRRQGLFIRVDPEGGDPRLHTENFVDLSVELSHGEVEFFFSKLCFGSLFLCAGDEPMIGRIFPVRVPKKLALKAAEVGGPMGEGLKIGGEMQEPADEVSRLFPDQENPDEIPA